MTTAIATIPNLPQIEGANLLNLMIVDDERAIREVCRDVAQTLGFHTSIADSAEHAYRVLESSIGSPLPNLVQSFQTAGSGQLQIQEDNIDGCVPFIFPGPSETSHLFRRIAALWFLL